MPQAISGRGNWPTQTTVPLPGEARNASDIATPVQDLMDRTQTNANNISALNTSVGNVNTALAGKAPLTHSHAQADVTGLTTALAGKANSSHTHQVSDIIGLSNYARVQLSQGLQADVTGSIGGYGGGLDGGHWEYAGVTVPTGKNAYLKRASAAPIGGGGGGSFLVAVCVNGALTAPVWTMNANGGFVDNQDVLIAGSGQVITANFETHSQGIPLPKGCAYWLEIEFR
ncbi:MAG TPA: hypothetical protein VHN99_05480 [Deinococcales bacterium]|nr:hypothetical protein [Deinococcales bacterium]